MFAIPGRPAVTCEGVTRREWLRIGGLAGIGGAALGLSELMAGRAVAADGTRRGEGFGRAKNCIVVFLFGAPAHQDTWDLKPSAPAEIRGEFQPISTSVPGIQVCEHMPLLARQAHRYLQIRSVTHPDNTHTVAMHYMLTGVRHRRPQTNPQNAPDDFPCLGAVLNYDRRGRPSPTGLPPAVSLNAPANQVSANNHIFPGFFAGFLGSAYEPMFVSQHANQADFQPLPANVMPRHLLGRQRLLQGLSQDRRDLLRAGVVRSFDEYHQRAFQLLTAPAARQALDIGREAPTVRERFGSTPFGQGCLLARRLVEAGVSLVTVNWERDDAYWDTHADNFKKHKDPLLPNFDRGFSALLEDLDQRGLLDETLVVVLSEFGRTPKINANAGRDHWAACNTVILAGAGIGGGQVYGASDREAAYPAADPVSPDDLAATIYHLLGVNLATILTTSQGQPVALTHGQPLWRLL
jgi:hypothetical protein